ncbi:MAG: acyl-CoA dehydrogenase family protein [Ideonella sp.]|nr:acyl-CoA dehydrogenase family protein [Ideonella sp.]MCC7457285.1 acyl-CoA dehydrogenase family protein [Nitrospira sp.]
MNFDLSDDQRAIRDAFARFVDQRVVPQAAAIDEARVFPRELFAELGGLGFFGLRYPESVGGSGLALPEFALALEEIARGSMSLAGAAAMQSLMGTKFLHLLGNVDIVERLLQPALKGEKIGAVCMTEPNAGSDLDGIATTARKVDGGYLLDGQKTWVTSAPVADFFTVFAKVGEEPDPQAAASPPPPKGVSSSGRATSTRRLTIFLVERNFKGLAVGREIHKMGVWALPTAQLAFDGCFVPDSHRLSKEEGDGEQHLRKLLAEIRIITGAMALGVARAALDAAQRYAGERAQFGKPINRFQAIQLKLAEMATGLESAVHLVRYAAWLHAAGRPHHKEAAMAKLHATETAAAVCDQAARVLASYGYAMEYPVQRYLRDVRFTLIGGGTSEILKLIIAKELAQ